MKQYVLTNETENKKVVFSTNYEACRFLTIDAKKMKRVIAENIEWNGWRVKEDIINADHSKKYLVQFNCQLTIDEIRTRLGISEKKVLECLNDGSSSRGFTFDEV